MMAPNANGELPKPLAKRRIEWNDDAFSALREVLVPWAIRRTKQRGRFSATAAAEQLLGKRNTEPVVALLENLAKEGHVERYGRLGWRWLGVDAPPVTRRSKPHKWTDERLNALRRDLEVWVREETARHGHFTAQDAADALDVPKNRLKPELSAMNGKNDLERLPGQLGYRSTRVEGPEPHVQGHKHRWTPDAISELRGRVESYARASTINEGRFTITGATDELLDCSNQEPIRRIVHALRDEGKVRFLSTRKGWAWDGVDAPEPDLGIPAQRKWTPERLEELKEEVEGWAVEQTRAHGRFTVSGATEELLGLTHKQPVSEVVDELEDEGKVVFLGQKMGFAFRGVVPPRVTLVELFRLAQDKKDPDHEDEHGRTGNNFRKIEVITENQFKDIQTAVGKVADFLGGGDASAVGSEHLGKDLARGDWRVIPDFRAWLDRTGVSSSYRNKLVSAVRNLLNLAATHGLIEGHACHVEDHEVYAAEWHNHVEAWVAEVLDENGGSSRGKVARGVRTLALYATRRHELSPKQVDWKALRQDFEDDIEESMAEQPDDEDRLKRLYDAVRYVWRRTPRLQEEWPWAIKRDQRIGLVANSALRSVVDNPAERDFSGFVNEEGKYLKTFVESPYGLRGLVDWATLPKEEAELDGLPPRHWPNPSERQRRYLAEERKRGNDDPLHLRSTTLLTRLQRINRIAGWATEHLGFDPMKDDLRALCDKKVVLEYKRWMKKRRSQTTYDPELQATEKIRPIGKIARTLSKISSPFLEWVAIRKGKDVDAKELREQSGELRRFGYDNQPTREASKEIDVIHNAWSVGGRDGYLRLVDLVDLLIEEAEQAEGRSLSEVVAAIENSREEAGSANYVPSLTWALWIRRAVMINLIRMIPLRSRTLSFLILDEWINDGGEAGAGGACLQKWQGAISLKIPGHKMKNGRAFHPPVIHEQDVGDPRFERGVRRLLLEAYFMDGGARHRLLRTDDEILDCPYIFPPAATMGRGKDGGGRLDGERFRPRSIQADFTRTVKELAPKLGLDLKRLKRLHGALGIHVVRLLFGSYWIKEDPELTRLMLTHSSLDFTMRLYSGRDPSNLRFEVSNQRESELPEVGINALLEEVKALRADLQDERARARELERIVWHVTGKDPESQLSKKIPGLPSQADAA